MSLLLLFSYGHNFPCQGSDYRAQLQFGSGSLVGANYIQVKRQSYINFYMHAMLILFWIE